jgi:hypothetical protein
MSPHKSLSQEEMDKHLYWKNPPKPAEPETKPKPAAKKKACKKKAAKK